MAARMQQMGIPDVWFYENREGGHGAAADNRQAAHKQAMVFEFLWSRIAG
jgi:prolyl oligopeptidase